MMKNTIYFISFILFLFLNLGNCRKRVPVFSNVYSVSGTLYLPYAELTEPFNAWYDADAKQSRIDYFQGMVKTYQLGNEQKYGSSIQIVPTTTEQYTNKPTCFKSDGDQDSPVLPQSILPDISDFKFAGTEIKEGYQCHVWMKIENNYNRSNTYTIWIRFQKNPKSPLLNEPIPVRYEMKGYNSLIGSHYDHYYLTYNNFVLEKPEPEIFKLPSNVSCDGHTNLLNDLHMYNMNPMKEYINRHTDHIDKAWVSFKTIHSKSYDNHEYENRKNIFTHNLRYIHSSNRKGLGYTLKVNHLADRSENELRMLRGGIPNTHSSGANKFPYTSEQIELITQDLPTNFDWRIQGAVTPVKDQATCGSCWSFASVGAMEGAYFIKTGNLKRFSEQALVDCTWGYGNNGCGGGNDDEAYKWIMKHGGIPTDEDYGYYLGQDGYCHIDTVNLTAPITGFVNVKANDENALRLAVFQHGPVSVFIDASHKSFSFYSNGVYYEPDCKNDPDSLDHVVLVIGYGNLNGKNYWLVKNSWSNHWGNQGYVLMSSKNNNCGVMTDPSYVTM